MIDLSWRIAAKNILRNKRRSLATMIATTVGFAGLVLLSGYIDCVDSILKTNTIYIKQNGHLSFYKKNAVENFFSRPALYALMSEDQDHVYAALKPWKNDIEFTASVITGMGLISSGEKSVPFMATGIDPEADHVIKKHAAVRKWTPELASDNGGADFKSVVSFDPSGISITKSLGEMIGHVPPFNKLTDEQRSVQLAAKNFFGDLNAVNANIRLSHTTGMAFLDNLSVQAPISVIQDLLSTDGITAISVFLKDEAVLAEMLKDLKQSFKKNNWQIDVYAYNDEAVGSFYLETMGFLFVMGGSFTLLILGAVALSVVNSMTMGIIERTKEIGTLRALGFTPRAVTGLFAKEALLLTIVSTAAGAALSLVVAAFVDHLDLRVFPPGTAGSVKLWLRPNVEICGYLTLLFLAISYGTSFLTVYRKTKIKIIDLLIDAGA